MDLVDRGLYERSSNGDVCQSCKTIPNEADGTLVHGTDAEGQGFSTAHFKLKPGLVWGDGTPVTANDFVAGWRAKKLVDRQSSIREIREVVAESADTANAANRPADSNRVNISHPSREALTRKPNADIRSSIPTARPTLS